MLTFLVTGMVLGLSAGLAPGPLLTLVVAETLQHGMAAGARVALAPLLTDLPIIVFTLFILTGLAHLHQVLGAISLIGAGFILYLGLRNFQVKGGQIVAGEISGKSLRKGILVNVLSPHPYLFWFSVGGPTTIRALDHGLPAAVSFIAGFYGLLIGSKILVSLLVGKSRAFLLGNRYVYTMRLLGLVLIILAGFLFRDGLRLLDIL